MSKLMELVDAYAQAAVNVEMGLYQGTASNYTQRLEAHDKARVALVAEIERVEIEAECFRFWVHEAWHSPADICKLLSKCETKEDYIAAIVPVIQARKAAVTKAMEATTNGQDS